MTQWLALALSLLLCLRSADFMPADGMLRSFADLNPSTTWVQCSTFALFCVPDGAASMPDDEKATFRNNYLTTTWSTWCEQVLKQPAPACRKQLPDVLKTQPCRCFLHVPSPISMRASSQIALPPKIGLRCQIC